MRESIENMRKLVYAFYDPNVSFKTVTEKHPSVYGDLTDCLSGDVNKDFSRMFAAFQEFTEIPSILPYGMPKTDGLSDPNLSSNSSKTPPALQNS
jgi:hypothetical protein